MKKILFCFGLLTSIYGYSQIGIGTTTVSASEVMRIAANLPGETLSRGILIPRVSLSSNVDLVTVPNPAVGLMLYNQSFASRGFYYWDSAKWERAFDKKSVLEIIVPAVNEVQSSTGGASQETATGGPVGYTVGLNTGESPTSRPWVALPGMSKTINIFSATNTTTITASGTIQASNTAVTSENQVHSYAVGIFINNKLYSVRLFILNGKQGMTCLADSFDIKANTRDLPTGNYTISVYAITRSELLGGTDIILNWGQPAVSCNNLNSDMAKGVLTLQTQQF